MPIGGRTSNESGMEAMKRKIGVSEPQFQSLYSAPKRPVRTESSEIVVDRSGVSFDTIEWPVESVIGGLGI